MAAGSQLTQGPDAEELQLRTASAEDRTSALELLRRAFGGAQDPRRWDWLFLENPARKDLYYVVADAGDRLAGQYATMPSRLHHSGRSILGLLSLDTATDPGFGRRGIFTRLASKLYESAREDAALVYGFPNANSAPGFYNKLGWVELRPFPLFGRPLGNVERPLASIRGGLASIGRAVDSLSAVGLLPAAVSLWRGERAGLRIVRVQDFGEWADELWSDLSRSVVTSAVRDAAFLRWRFVEAPYPYTILGVERDARLVGFVALRIRPWRGAAVADLMELMARADDPPAADMLLAAAVLSTWSQSSVGMRAIVSPNHPHRDRFLRAGIFPVPKRWTTDRSFGVRILNSAAVNPNEVLHMDDWYISGADLDYI